ncbi:hypothetical protein YQE_02579, partial [Dendroctonus ponderosae]
MLARSVTVGASKTSISRVKTLWNLKLSHLDPKTPVASDIEIARSHTPKDVNILAEEIGLLPTEVSPYG